MNRFEEIAGRLLPKGVTVEYVRPPTGDRARFNYETGLLQAPRPVDAQSLWGFLHECAHAIFHRDRSIFERVPRHVTEYECERWARDRLLKKKFSQRNRIPYFFPEKLGLVDIRSCLQISHKEIYSVVALVFPQWPSARMFG
jgi:hypothetical protein